MPVFGFYLAWVSIHWILLHASFIFNWYHFIIFDFLSLKASIAFSNPRDLLLWFMSGCICSSWPFLHVCAKCVARERKRGRQLSCNAKSAHFLLTQTEEKENQLQVAIVNIPHLEQQRTQEFPCCGVMTFKTSPSSALTGPIVCRCYRGNAIKRDWLTISAPWIYLSAQIALICWMIQI